MTSFRSLRGPLACATLCLVAWAANAAPTLGSLSAGNSTFGSETITRDSVTNLEWLDLNLTAAYSYSSITALMGTGSIFSGFRVATDAEANAMILHSGILGAAVGNPAEQAFNDLIALLSPTAVDDVGGTGCVLGLDGIVEPGRGGGHTVEGVGIDRKPAAANGCGPVLPGSQFITRGPVFSGFYIDDNTTVTAHNASSPLTLGGIYLVRPATTVPEPATLFLALSAGGLAAWARKRAIHKAPG